MSPRQNKDAYLPALFQWLSASHAPYARTTEAFEAELRLEEEKLSAAAQSALLHPEDRAVGCVIFGRVEVLREIVNLLHENKPEKQGR